MSKKPSDDPEVKGMADMEDKYPDSQRNGEDCPDCEEDCEEIEDGDDEGDIENDSGTGGHLFLVPNCFI